MDHQDRGRLGSDGGSMQENRLIELEREIAGHLGPFVGVRVYEDIATSSVRVDMSMLLTKNWVIQHKETLDAPDFAKRLADLGKLAIVGKAKRIAEKAAS